jgi:hypothetical protein
MEIAPGMGPEREVPTRNDDRQLMTPEKMNEDTHPLVSLTDEGLQALLRRVFRNTLILGLIASIALLMGSGWRNAAMLATGALISAASILEWQRLIRLINAKMDRQQTPRAAFLAVLFLLFRLIVFAGAIYVSLKCFQGSVVELLIGLGLAVLVTLFEAVRLLR